MGKQWAVKVDVRARIGVGFILNPLTVDER